MCPGLTKKIKSANLYYKKSLYKSTAVNTSLVLFKYADAISHPIANNLILSVHVSLI